MKNNWLKELVLNSYSKEFFEGLEYATEQSYLIAHAEVSNNTLLDKENASVLLGHLRRAIFETKFKELALDMTYQATTERTLQKFPYTLVKSGKLLLTLSHVNDQISNLSPAKFRKQHSGLNLLLQQTYFGFLGKSFEPDSVYGIILHGNARTNPKKPVFLKLAFPSADGKQWLEEFPIGYIIKSYPTLPEESEIPKPILKPKKREMS